MLDVFAGFTETPPFRSYPGAAEANLAQARSTWAHIYDGPGYLYIAPREVPVEVRAAGFQMVTSVDEEIVVSRQYLAEGPLLDLYLDVIHEFLHILQRKQGRELWPGLGVAYVDRPTEIEAYAYSVAEARRLGVPDAYLRKYLETFWITRAEYLRLLRHVGVRPPKPRRKSGTRPRSRARSSVRAAATRHRPVPPRRRKRSTRS